MKFAAVYTDKRTCSSCKLAVFQSAAVALVTVGGCAAAAWLMMSFGIWQWQSATATDVFNSTPDTTILSMKLTPTQTHRLAVSQNWVVNSE